MADELPEGHRPPEDRTTEHSCMSCGAADGEAQHHVYRGARMVRRGDGKFAIGLDGQPVLEEVWEARHVECCADNGCGVCSVKMEHAGGRRGRRLTDWLVAGGSPAMHKALVKAGHVDGEEA